MSLPVWTSVSHLGNAAVTSHLPEWLWRPRQHADKAFSLVSGCSIICPKTRVRCGGRVMLPGKYWLAVGGAGAGLEWALQYSPRSQTALSPFLGKGSASLEVSPNLCVHDLPIDVGRGHQSVQGAGGTVRDGDLWLWAPEPEPGKAGCPGPQLPRDAGDRKQEARWGQDTRKRVDIGLELSKPVLKAFLPVGNISRGRYSGKTH